MVELKYLAAQKLQALSQTQPGYLKRSRPAGRATALRPCAGSRESWSSAKEHAEDEALNSLVLLRCSSLDHEIINVLHDRLGGAINARGCDEEEKARKIGRSAHFDACPGVPTRSRRRHGRRGPSKSALKREAASDDRTSTVPQTVPRPHLRTIPSRMLILVQNTECSERAHDDE